MTESEWLSSLPPLMLAHVANTAPVSPRKLRLLGVAYARFLETQSDYADARRASYLGEQVAEGVLTRDAVMDQHIWANPGDWRLTHLTLVHDDQLDMAVRKGIVFSEQADTLAVAATSTRFALARKYICCIVGSPFRPVAFDPRWNTSTVLCLAQAIYADRAFDRLPILADALEEAGCDHLDVLRHCREEATHARGCWVIDGLLGKA